MLNQYFEATEDNLDFIFANAALENIYFALVSLNYIFNHSDFDEHIYVNEHTFYFFHIQSILTACSNISSIFYNSCSDIRDRSDSVCACKRFLAELKWFNVKEVYN